MGNLKPRTQNFSRVGAYTVRTHPRKILGFRGSFSCPLSLLRTVFLKPLILRARRARKIKGFRKTVRSVEFLIGWKLGNFLAGCG